MVESRIKVIVRTDSRLKLQTDFYIHLLMGAQTMRLLEICWTQIEFSVSRIESGIVPPPKEHDYESIKDRWQLVRQGLRVGS